MSILDDKTRAHFNQRIDLLHNGIGVIWAIYNKYMTTFDTLSLQQAVNEFQSMKYTATA